MARIARFTPNIYRGHPNKIFDHLATKTLSPSEACYFAILYYKGKTRQEQKGSSQIHAWKINL